MWNLDWLKSRCDRFGGGRPSRNEQGMCSLLLLQASNRGCIGRASSQYNGLRLAGAFRPHLRAG